MTPGPILSVTPRISNKGERGYMAKDFLQDQQREVEKLHISAAEFVANG
jgi:hypothetical protein